MLSVVILSRDIGNLIPCLNAIERYDPGLHIVVVDDGLGKFDYQPSVDIVAGVHPFIFARNANLGISHAFHRGADAVILLNDDALLERPKGFTKLFAAWVDSPEFGLVASSCNNVGNTNQEPKYASFIRTEPRMVCFICVLIPRSTWERVGPLDEEFAGYGFEDDAYCVMVRRAGLKLGIYDGCFVDHSKLNSSFRSKKYPIADFEKNHQLFRRKYGERI